MSGFVNLQPMATLAYDDISGEGYVLATEDLGGANSTIAIDMLGDWIAELEDFREALMDCRDSVDSDDDPE